MAWNGRALIFTVQKPCRLIDLQSIPRGLLWRRRQNTIIGFVRRLQFSALLAASLTIKRKRLSMLSVCLSVGLSVGRSVGPKGVCDKTADWIWMPFGLVSTVGRGMGDGCITGVESIEGKGQYFGQMWSIPL